MNAVHPIAVTAGADMDPYEGMLTCCGSLSLSLAVIGDAACCLACCCCCACCGTQPTCLQRRLPERFKHPLPEPGHETCAAACQVQLIAAIVVPSTCCLCCLCCCGTATPVAKCVYDCVGLRSPGTQQMAR